jgi:soluble lytic murein transglycosylase-like protein
MKLRLAGKSGPIKVLAVAGGFLSVLLNCTPALNLTYRYVDSKGYIHITNFSLPKPPAAASHSLSQVNQENASSAGNPAAGSTAGDSDRISRVTDRQGTIRISNPVVPGSPQHSLALAPASNQRNAVGPMAASKAQRQIYALIAANAGAGSKVSQPGVADAAPMGGTDPNSGATGIFTPLEPSWQVSLVQGELPGGVSPMALCVDQQGKMYHYNSQVVAGDDSFLDAPIISWKNPANQNAGRGLTEQPRVATVSAAMPAAPVSAPYKRNSLAFRQASGSSLPASGKIRIFRDGRGFTHIINNGEIRKNFAAPPPESLISAISCSQASSTNLSAVMLPPGTSKIVSNGPAGLNTGFSRILSRKDASGRLIISNRQRKTADCPSEADLAMLGANRNADLETVMAAAAQHYRLPLPLVKAIVRAESGFAPQAVSWKGAMGLMQLMPATAACLGVKDPFCPQQNIMGGCRYFRDLLDKLNGSVPLSLAAYNAGLQRVINAGYAIPAIAETQNFVEKVIKYFFIYAQQNYDASKI